ncbi:MULTISPECIES: hypothetical protein [Winogradskyella]|uniref:hypothetical protein n=1 Tax=Winogradskyella TaxID=286104 RepID=UPI0015CB1FEF|nr:MULTISPECIES: hypothetical protein [Winogradskyella]QNK76787.1 hypothetical protein H7F37_11725 [Winogradskyella sp. PAMC22761]QXP80623.1 hypothetical protein H0I32_08405 [Winogradskyella sp. HaHa_3_26]
MKKGLVILLLLFVSLNVFSQSTLGRIELRPEFFQKKLKKKQIKILKTAKTYFVIPDQFNNGYTREDYKKILDEVWTVNTIELITENEVEKRIKIGDVLFRFISRSVRLQGVKYVFNYFKLSEITLLHNQHNVDKVFSWDDNFYGGVFFTTHAGVEAEIAQLNDVVNNGLFDYRIGYLKNYFQQINNAISDSESYDIFKDYVDDEKIKTLKKVSLFIPENIIYGFTSHTASEKTEITKELFKDYTYNKTVLTAEELNEKILNEKQPFYYLMYHQNNFHKIITVVDGVSGEIIYRRYKRVTYNIDFRDFKALNRIINKS